MMWGSLLNLFNTVNAAQAASPKPQPRPAQSASQAMQTITVYDAHKNAKTLDSIEIKITFPESGSDTLEEKYPKYADEKVYINETQYFGNVSKEVWGFYVGGYQPAQKWLKDRRGRKLSNYDIEHYQNIVKALEETYKIMNS